MNARKHRVNVPTYPIELVLDHMASHIYSIGLCAIEGKKLDFPSIAAAELTDLDRIAEQVGNCKVPENTKEEFTRYIFVTRTLLEELGKLPSLEGAV